jgi:hypothetical protein
MCCEIDVLVPRAIRLIYVMRTALSAEAGFVFLYMCTLVSRHVHPRLAEPEGRWKLSTYSSSFAWAQDHVAVLDLSISKRYLPITIAVTTFGDCYYPDLMLPPPNQAEADRAQEFQGQPENRQNNPCSRAQRLVEKGYLGGHSRHYTTTDPTTKTLLAPPPSTLTNP